MKAFASFACFARNLLPLLLISACSEPAGPESKLSELQKSRESLQIENNQLREKAAADEARIKILEEELRVKNQDWAERSSKMAEESRARLEKSQALESRIQAMAAELEILRKVETGNARLQAKDSKIPVLATRNGEVYEDVTIVNVVADGIHILHQTGATKVPFTQLDASWAQRFGYDAKEAAAYEKAETDAKLAAQKAQVEELARQKKAEAETLSPRKTSGKGAEISGPALELKNLRAELWAELQKVRKDLNGRLDLGGVSKNNPEHAACFDNNLIALRLSKARDLRAQINQVKNQYGLY